MKLLAALARGALGARAWAARLAPAHGRRN